MVKALEDSHARGCEFKSCLTQDKDYWLRNVTGVHLHKCAHSPGRCPFWLVNRLHSKLSTPHTKNCMLTGLTLAISVSDSEDNSRCSFWSLLYGCFSTFWMDDLFWNSQPSQSYIQHILCFQPEDDITVYLHCTAILLCWFPLVVLSYLW